MRSIYQCNGQYRHNRHTLDTKTVAVYVSPAGKDNTEGAGQMGGSCG